MSKDCTVCGEPVTLVPSAKERARKFGGKPEDYTAIFTRHTSCALKKRAESAKALMAKTREDYEARQARRVFV